MSDVSDFGEFISHYKLEDQIGAGGMGVVFKARDLKLDRPVALKFLPVQMHCSDEEKQRFIQEAKVTSALDHPNICTIYEVDETNDGRMFIAMAYYEGENLRQRLEKGPLAVELAVSITSQICEGLSKAHSRGIIHRDMKPDNVILTEDGIVKIVDFGISKLVGVQGLTQPGTLIGTPHYMSPEQIKGELVDHRSDIWAVGILLYNMLTCDMPFKADTNLTLLYNIVNHPPASIRKDIPGKFSHLIQKALSKNPADRYQDIADLKIDLLSEEVPSQFVATHRFAAEIPRIPSIAVMPFQDMSLAQDQGYLSEGLSEAVTTILTRVEDLRVVSRNSVFHLHEQKMNTREIGRRLEVDQILQGSVRKFGEQIRVSIQLVNVIDGVIQWAEDFKQSMDAIFELEDEITQRLVNILKVKLKHGKEEYDTGQTDNAEAYTAYLKGRYHWNRRTAANLKKSIGFFTEAIDIDSGFAQAYAGLSDAQIILGMYGLYSPDDVMPRAKDSAVRALQIDPGLAEAHVSLGCIESVYYWRWLKAEEEFRRGIELNPNYATGHHWYSVNHLVPRGRFDEAINEIQEALNLDPVSLAINATIGLTYYFAGDSERATHELKRTLEMDENFPMANFFLGQAYAQRAMFDESLSHYRKALELYGKNPNMLASYGFASAMAGMHETTQQALDELLQQSQAGYVSSFDIALLLLGLERVEEAMSKLQRALEERSYMMIYLNVNPMLEGLRSIPEFQDLVRTIFRH